MHTLNTIKGIKEEFKIPHIADTRVSFCLLAARRNVRQIVGEAAYDHALLNGDVTLASAEAQFFAYHLLLQKPGAISGNSADFKAMGERLAKKAVEVAA